MSEVDRRTFLALMGVPAVAAALPRDLDQALAIPANNRRGTIEDVEHVIFLMQENRSFDHYFGTLRGVRGFADPHPVTLPSGRACGTSRTARASCCPSDPRCATWVRHSCRTRRTAGATPTPRGTPEGSTSGCPTRA